MPSVGVVCHKRNGSIRGSVPDVTGVWTFTVAKRKDAGKDPDNDRPCDQDGHEGRREKQAKARINFALEHPSCPKVREAYERLRKLPARYRVLVFRTTTRKLEGTFVFFSVKGETAGVQTGRTRRVL